MNELAGAGMSALIGNAFDIMSENRANARYRRNQAEANQHERDMMNLAKENQMDIWNRTNYEAQVEHMRNAGLNPALMYKGGGMSGQTGSASASPRQAPVISHTGMMTGMAVQGMNIANMESQIKLNESQANKNNAEAAAIGGYKAEESKATTSSLLQGVSNQKAQEALTRAQTRMTSIQADIADQSMEDVIKKVNYEAHRAFHEVKTAQYEADLSEATYNDKITIVQEDAIGAMLRNAATKSQIQLTEQQIRKTAQDIINSIESVKQRGEEINIKSFDTGLKGLRPGLQEILGEGIIRLFNVNYRNPKHE